MTYFRDSQLSTISFRIVVVAISLFLFVAIVVVHLFDIQVLRHSFYKKLADDNRIVLIPVQPSRGLIKDRDGRVVADNKLHYTLDVKSNYLASHPDLLDRFSLFFPITSEDKKAIFAALRGSQHGDQYITIKEDLTDSDVSSFSSYRFLFPYIYLGTHFFRYYPYGDVASHLMGYMGNISDKDWKNLEETNSAGNYRGTMFIGQQGVEKQYEAYLHGFTGYSASEVTAAGQVVRPVGNHPPQDGSDIYLTIDFPLQQFADSLMKGKRGAIVVLQPKTGEILALSSSPNVDPNLFSRGIDSKHWKNYIRNVNHPLINRVTSSLYAPGSTYKPYVALAALMLGYRTQYQTIDDTGYFILGNHKFRDDTKGGHGRINISDAIALSCDVYFFQLAHEMGPDVIHDFNKQFGFGDKTGIDLPYELSGILPSRSWKKSHIHQNWYDGDSVSLGVGQGYNAFTPIQVAQAVQVLSNHGEMMQLHIVKAIQGQDRVVPILPIKKRVMKWDDKVGNVIIQSMRRVCKSGTARDVFKNVSYSVAGKTGTAQVVNMKGNYNPNEVDEFERDHSWFIAFSPVDNPEIALVVLVENGGWGAKSAAPVARKIMDFYYYHRDDT
ncbi:MULTISPECIES: penicillin-binding protein 2 [Candidatus Ichthyocystis]|uniref:Penicillin-binding protein 2 n=1 Tax=Candidatus Ichthyocystis hellenicum TaxID=1561003 RepID=A0A0S4M303_9BURK|nr:MULTISPECIES: penicillin-binding protein 2 [Ichthyocystis]CUT17250.1 Penicillin-binding protein 2 [Candidatus Ichthyocystis hellenicum]